MKTRLLTAFIFIHVNFLFAQIINPAWKPVGPYSDNCVPTNWFRSGQIDDIAVDPGSGFENHIIVSSFYAGIWEMPDITAVNANWDILPGFDDYLPDGMECNGVGAVTFRTHTELFAGGCNAVFKYDYLTQTWTLLNTLPSGTLINKIVFTPSYTDTAFLCTSIGLYESTDASSSNPTFTFVTGANGWIHSMAFIEKTSPGGYFWYIAGQNTSHAAMVMESADDGVSFHDASATYASTYSGTTSYAGICLGNQTDPSGDRDIYIATAISTSRPLDKLTINIYGGTPALANLSTSLSAEYAYEPNRLIVGYDATNQQVLTGGVGLFNIDLGSNATNQISPMHSDNHGIYINTSVTPNQIFIAGDGGFYSLSYGSSSYTATPLNYGLDICLINGFSGATESNQYVYGYQDHAYSDLYDEPSGKVIATHAAGENDGGLIDKFNGNHLIIADRSSYSISIGYYVSTDDPNDFDNASLDYWFPPMSLATYDNGNGCQGDHDSPYYYFEPSYCSFPLGQSFGRHPFFQEPFREGRIYAAAQQASLFQFDPVSNKFVWKVRLSEDSQHYTNSPTLSSSNCSTCTPDPAKPLQNLHYDSQPVALSFSQLDKNIMYVIVSNTLHPSAAQVVQYIGNNRDDIWLDHNEQNYNNNNANPQWQLITPDWLSSPFNLSNGNNEIYHIVFTGIETSNWDKDKIYVSCASDLASFTMPYKVVTYDRTTSTWSDYSNGIPPGENVTAMIMDHASNDGIYASTENGVYYRDRNAGMNAWVSYNTAFAGGVMPFVRSTQMEINYRENSVRAGTYGRGIWKSDLVCPSNGFFTIPASLISGYREADDITTSGTVVAVSPGPTVFRATNSISLEPGFEADATSGANYFTAFIHGCITGSSTSSYNYYRNSFDISQEMIKNPERNTLAGKLIVYPNPTSAKFTFKVPGDEPNQILIYNSFGQVILNQSIQSEVKEIDLTQQPPGIYFIKVFGTENSYTTKIIKR